MTQITPKVNAHTHLELGWTGQFRPKQPRPFHYWMKRFMKRNAMLRKKEQILDSYQNSSVQSGIQTLLDNGTTHVGEITLSGISIEPLLESGLGGVVYIEVLGLEDAVGEFMFQRAVQLVERHRPDEQNGLRIGLSAHAPYTTTPATFRQVSNYCQKHDIPLCIHAAESPAEMECVQHGRGPLFDLPIELGGASRPYVPYKTPIQYLSDIGVLDAQPLLVHAVHVTDEELELIGKSGSKIAHCPRSNYYLDCGRHPLEKALAHNIPVALGTDSLATSPSLDITDELEFACELHHEHVPASTLERLTTNPDIF